MRADNIGLFSELNTKTPPKFKGLTSFCKVSERRFYGLEVYVRNHLRGHILHVPDEDVDLKMVHLIIKNTTLVCKVFACYLDVESRATQDKTSKVWHKLQGKMDAAIERSEAAILLGDLN